MKTHTTDTPELIASIYARTTSRSEFIEEINRYHYLCDDFPDIYMLHGLCDILWRRGSVAMLTYLRTHPSTYTSVLEEEAEDRFYS